MVCPLSIACVCVCVCVCVLSIVCLSCYVALGLHINLSEGVPVSSVQAVGSLLSADKVFLGKAGIRNALENGILNMEEVYLLITAYVAIVYLTFSLILERRSIQNN